MKEERRPLFFLSNDKGVALMMVLWVMTLLFIIVMEFAYAMRMELWSAGNFKDDTEAYYLALAGINLALAEALVDYDFNYLDKEGRLVFAIKEGGEINAPSVKREMALGRGHLSYTIIDENGKLNINTVKAKDMIIRLIKATGVEMAERDIIADSILDWRDKNHAFHLNGAEDDYYLSLPEPYEAKDGNLDTVEELLLVKGVTPLIFYGKDDLPPEFPYDKEEGSYTGIGRHITVTGDGTVNINTASEEVLEAAFGVMIAQEILLRRQTEGFFDRPQYKGVVVSKTFTLEATGEVNGIEYRVKAIVDRTQKRPRITYWKEGI
ncbi:MAG: general secretion pathway protein GspK [Thermodesulfobacteriota bacterium]